MDIYDKVAKVMRMTNAAKAGATTGMIFSAAAMGASEKKDERASIFFTEVAMRYTLISTETALKAKELSDEIGKELGVE